jgi:hypothetical protein
MLLYKRLKFIIKLEKREERIIYSFNIRLIVKVI